MALGKRYLSLSKAACRKYEFGTSTGSVTELFSVLCSVFLVLNTFPFLRRLHKRRRRLTTVAFFSSAVG